MTMTNAEWCVKNNIKFKEIHVPYDTKAKEAKIVYKNKEIGRSKICDTSFAALKAWLDMDHEETEVKHKDVKHAHWIDMRLDDVHVCSHCDNVVVFMNGNDPVYCPYCGARMDEEDKS